MDFLEKTWRGLRDRMKTKGFPVITTSLLSLGAGVVVLGRPEDPSDRSAGGYLRRAGIYAYKLIKEKGGQIPVLPPQCHPKPVVVFDCSELLLKRDFSFFSFDFLVARRAFTDIFLFHTAHLYELIHVSECSSRFNRLLLQRMDPYGCISYKVYCGDKKKFTSQHLNRPLEKTVVISTRHGEYHEDFNSNVVRLGKWSGKPECGLLDLVNFLYSLHFINVEDFRNTLRSYWGKEFYSTFNKVQENIFVSRNLFTWNTRKKYKKRIEEINRKRVEDFQRAREKMDKDLKENPKDGEGSTSGWILGFVVKAYF